MWWPPGGTASRGRRQQARWPGDGRHRARRPPIRVCCRGWGIHGESRMGGVSEHASGRGWDFFVVRRWIGCGSMLREEGRWAPSSLHWEHNRRRDFRWFENNVLHYLQSMLGEGFLNRNTMLFLRLRCLIITSLSVWFYLQEWRPFNYTFDLAVLLHSPCMQVSGINCCELNVVVVGSPERWQRRRRAD